MHEKLGNAGCELGYLVEMLRDESFCDECRVGILLRIADRAAALADAACCAQPVRRAHVTLQNLVQHAWEGGGAV